MEFNIRICVGFEVLFTDCDEFGFHNGFNFIVAVRKEIEN